MRRFFSLVCFCFVSSIGLSAQELRQGYLDTVKGFFRVLINAQQNINGRVIVGNAIFLDSQLDSMILNVQFNPSNYIDRFLIEETQ